MSASQDNMESPAYQLSFEDVNNLKLVQSQPSRTAFIDECGSFGFDFSSPGNSKYYILCAVIVEDSKDQAMRDAFEEVKKSNGFSNTEMKSSKIGNDYKRRSRITSQLLQIDFRVILLVADKQEFVKGSPLREYKKTFIKYLHERLYDCLYHTYPKLKIIEDETGSQEFQESFKKYVISRRPQSNLFNEYDFDYTDSKNEVLVQLADWIVGTVYHYLTDNASPNYLEMLKAKIMSKIEFPSLTEPYWGKAKPEEHRYNRDIFALSVKCATDYIAKHQETDTDEKRAQIAFLRYLLFYVKNIDPTKYLYSGQMLSVIREATNQKATRDFLYRRVVAPLRDEGVIIASSSHGYKIPISVEDIKTYLNSTHTIVAPMLHRIEKCRQLILQQTSNNLDILDDPAFLKYKKYFD